ncbi:uncharacterized protein LOC108742377 [Agrilus planipennis]|uniref:Uncharacterized protein LOC108742377 n=1 Tax=Agrilus planipennis TaxID=224129 RepID=A0A7F5R5A1_AGRPL|nr:uncharacterized protein LOC108742377 [Agrilus planipennis]
MDSLEEENVDCVDYEINLKEILDKVERQVDFYRENSATLREALSKLNILKEDLCSEYQNKLNKLAQYQEMFGTTDCKPESIALSHIDQLRKQNVYMAKVKTCRKMYINLNEKLTKDIKKLKSEYAHSKEKIECFLQVSNDEIKAHQLKIQRYEEQLAKFEEKYPWLKNPELDLNNITKEIQALNQLKEKKIKLMKEMDVYQGLKPDITEAREQLEDIKKKYNELNNSFNTYNNIKNF